MREPVGQTQPRHHRVEPRFVDITAGGDVKEVMFSAAVSVGTRLNAWNTNPIRSRRNVVMALSPSAVSSTSPMRTLPDVATSSPARQCACVDSARTRRSHDRGELARGGRHRHPYNALPGVAGSVELGGTVGNCRDLRPGTALAEVMPSRLP